MNLAKSIEERKPVEYIDYQNIAEIENWIEELKSEMAEPPEPVRKLLSALFHEEYE